MKNNFTTNNSCLELFQAFFTLNIHIFISMLNEKMSYACTEVEYIFCQLLGLFAQVDTWAVFVFSISLVCLKVDAWSLLITLVALILCQSTQSGRQRFGTPQHCLLHTINNRRSRVPTIDANLKTRGPVLTTCCIVTMDTILVLSYK